MHTSSKSTVRDMTEGSIVSHLIGFSIPLLLGNVFQMLYNTVDSIVVGNFVGKQALAAISSTTMIVNIMIFFFNGFSIGGGVVISRYFGAKKMEDLHRAVETTIAVTILFGIFFTFAGFLLVPAMLRLMSTPDDVMCFLRRKSIFKSIFRERLAFSYTTWAAEYCELSETPGALCIFSYSRAFSTQYLIWFLLSCSEPASPAQRLPPYCHSSCLPSSFLCFFVGRMISIN